MVHFDLALCWQGMARFASPLNQERHQKQNQMKKTIEASKVENNGKTYWRVCIPLALRSQNDGCTRRFFPEKKDAVAFADKLNRSRQSWSALLLAMPEPDQGQLVLTLQQINWDVALLQRAMQAYHTSKAQQEIPLTEAIAKFIATKPADTKHTPKVAKLLEKFAAPHQGKLVHAITGDDIVSYIQSDPRWTNTTKRWVYAILSSFFRWAAKKAQGYTQSNPCEVMNRPKADRPEIGYYTTEEIGKLLRAAYEHDRPMVSYIAIGYFAGPRKSELLQLTSRMIIDDHFLLPAEITKMRIERVVPITPVLREWLAIDCTLDGWPRHVARFVALSKLAGVAPSRNGLRHGYGTHNAPVLNIEETAKRMGDTPMICRRHYANPRVTRAELASYHSLADMSPAKVLGQALTQKAA
jgi:integrase